MGTKTTFKISCVRVFIEPRATYMDSDYRIALIVALHFLLVYLVSRPMAKQTISIDCKHEAPTNYKTQPNF